MKDEPALKNLHGPGDLVAAQSGSFSTQSNWENFPQRAVKKLKDELQDCPEDIYLLLQRSSHVAAGDRGFFLTFHREGRDERRDGRDGRDE